MSSVDHRRAAAALAAHKNSVWQHLVRGNGISDRSMEYIVERFDPAIPRSVAFDQFATESEKFFVTTGNPNQRPGFLCNSLLCF